MTALEDAVAPFGSADAAGVVSALPAAAVLTALCATVQRHGADEDLVACCIEVIDQLSGVPTSPASTAGPLAAAGKAALDVVKTRSGHAGNASIVSAGMRMLSKLLQTPATAKALIAAGMAADVAAFLRLLKALPAVFAATCKAATALGKLATPAKLRSAGVPSALTGIVGTATNRSRARSSHRGHRDQQSRWPSRIVGSATDREIAATACDALDDLTDNFSRPVDLTCMARFVDSASSGITRHGCRILYEA